MVTRLVSSWRLHVDLCRVDSLRHPLGCMSHCIQCCHYCRFSMASLTLDAVRFVQYPIASYAVSDGSGRSSVLYGAQ